MFSRVVCTAATLMIGFVCSSHAAPFERQQQSSFRVAHLPASAPHKPGFSRIASSVSGIAFTNTLSQARAAANANLMNGAGVALGDYDGDGLCDIYLCDLGGTNALYKNLGNWQFKNVTDEAGVACSKQTSTAAVFADINGDGKLDLLVSSMGGPHACFINLGNGRFTNTIASAGFSSRYGGMSLAVADVDGNGTLDLYQANYGATSIIRSGGALNISYVDGKPVVKGRYAQRIKIIDNTMFELGEPDALLLNDGSGHFKAVSWTDGTFLKPDGSPLKEADIPWDQGLSAMFHDVNGDGAPDLYVCNDAFTPDRFWINDGKGHFREAPHRNWRTTSHFSMGVDFADIDRDGHDDFFVVDMLSRHHNYAATQKGNMPPQPFGPGDFETQLQVRRNTFQRNNGDGSFSELAYFSGIAGSEWSWSAVFLDVDLDGWEDLLVCNGFPHNADDMDTQEKVKAMGQIGVEQSRRNVLLFPPLITPHLAFQNNHDLTFAERSQEWGFDAAQIGNGMALADLDNDGDLDVVINCLNSGAIVYRNESSAARLGVRLKGKAGNTEGIGARIKVEGGPVAQTQEMISGGRYLSCDEAMRVFACGASTKMRIEVTWRNGARSVVENAEPNCVYEIDEAGATAGPTGRQKIEEPLFHEESAKLGHKHFEQAFDDFALQPSLLRRLSQRGPGVVVADLNDDGFDDIVLGTGRGGDLSLLTNGTAGKFAATAVSWNKGESGAMFAWKRPDGITELLVGHDNYEQKSGRNISAFAVTPNGTVQSLDYGNAFAGNDTGGALALAFVNAQPVLFAAGGFQPGRYPEAAPSHLYRFEMGKWKPDVQNDARLKSVGLVSGAVWTDLDSDGAPELVLACEWGPIRVFGWSGSQLVERTRDWGLEQVTGLWQGVAAADFDGDGKMDLVAGNWGLNSFYNQAADRSVELYYGEFTAPGRVEMLEAYRDPEMGKIVPWRDKRALSAGMPWLNEKFPLHRQYAEASIADILQGRPAAVNRLVAASLASAVFLNRGNRFEVHSLPREAQFAPVFGLCVADLDGDGKEDIFLAQNFFAVREQDSRLDAGRGLLLRGDGHGAFEAVTSQESGLAIFGEQRGCATGDFDHDGRVDLVVSQNGNETKLYRNARATPGIRISLKGPAQNPWAIGAQFRIGSGGQWGALHEIGAGSGYMSESSVTKIVARAQGEGRLQIRWPGEAKTDEFAVSNMAEQITVEFGKGVVTRP